MSFICLRTDFVTANVTLHSANSFSVYFTVNKNIDTFYVNLAMTLRNDHDKNRYDPFINTTINACAFLKKKETNHLLKIFFEAAVQLGTIPQRCPVLKVNVQQC